MALLTLSHMRGLSCVAAALLLSLTEAASAQDSSRQDSSRQDSSGQDSPPAMTGVARPSVEELAIPPEPQKDTQAAGEAAIRESICLIVEAAARDNGLPLEFFARVIWQESRFQAHVVGPVTRNGQRAEGIAQFMPGTASERRLLDPFDPVQALPKAAEFLAELRAQFGNLGLAAAAYNAGPRRVQEWLAGTGGMPQETRNYVVAITGSTVEDWAKADKGGKTPDATPPTTCRDLIALLKRAPNPFVAGLEQHVQLAAAKVWGVQLAAGFDRNRALASYSRAMKRLQPVIGDQDPSLLATVFRSRGTRTFYQVRIGADTRPAADALCNRIRTAGEACFVLRNHGMQG